MPESTSAAIGHLLVGSLKEMLGFSTCLSGKPNGHIKAMKDKVQE